MQDNNYDDHELFMRAHIYTQPYTRYQYTIQLFISLFDNSFL